MSGNPDILYITEYIRKILYFATVKQGKVLKSNDEVHYFNIDNELIYENYYCDFGPLNLGCVYKYCKLLNEKLKSYSNKTVVVHYTSIDAKQKANAAFLIGCYGVLYLNLSPRDAIRPLLVHGQSYRPFQDATQGDSIYTISITDCLQAIKKARELGLFNFHDFNYEEYERLDKIHGGDLNWIVPGKFLAFIGPVDYSVSLYHPPEMYIEYFLENNVTVVIRLNKRLYDGNVFNNKGIRHYDLYFPDGSVPPRHILVKFMKISEHTDGAIAVHCKAGLGRTGSLIGCYLIKHYRMSAREAIGWMRICRPGSVIGHQQEWLEKLEQWLHKQGNLYRKELYQNMEELPTHQFGIYSIKERTMRQRTVLFRHPSPPLPVTRPIRKISEVTPRPQISKVRETSNKVPETEQFQWRVNSSQQKFNPNNCFKSVSRETSDTLSAPQRTSGAGDPRTRVVSPSRSKVSNANFYKSDLNTVNTGFNKMTFRTPQGPIIKTINDAKNFLIDSTLVNAEQVKKLSSSVIVTPHFSRRSVPLDFEKKTVISRNVIPSAYNNVPRTAQSLSNRRRLGRSPSPPQVRNMVTEHSRATNTPSSSEKFLKSEASKTALKDLLSRLKLPVARDGSVGAASTGAASLGARRDAPVPMRAPSVRSDERPLATQGDLLNSIKFQKRLREAIHMDKLGDMFRDKVSLTVKKPTILQVTSKTSTDHRVSATGKEKQPVPKAMVQRSRSPTAKGRTQYNTFN